MSCTSSATSDTQAFSSMTRPMRTPTTRPPTTAGNVTSSKAGITVRSTGTSNAMTATSPTVGRRTNSNSMDGVSTATIRGTASVRTTTILNAGNAASGTSDRCIGSNTRDGRSTPPTPTTASARNAPRQGRKRNKNHSADPCHSIHPHALHGARHPGTPREESRQEMKVKKTLMDMIVKWHQAGYSLDEIAPLVPQVPKEEIKAIIQQHHE